MSTSSIRAKFSSVKEFKKLARKLQRERSIPTLSMAQELLAKESGYRDLHQAFTEIRKVEQSKQNGLMDFVLSKLKSTQVSQNSTILYDRYHEWTKELEKKDKDNHWFFGEYVKKEGFSYRKVSEDFSIFTLGQSGSGRTEAMKTWLLAWLCRHPSTSVIISDLKCSGDWDVFAPLTEFGSVLKNTQDTLMALLYAEDVLETRRKHLYMSNRNLPINLNEETQTIFPPLLIVLDEFPQLKADLRYDELYMTPGTPAHALYQILLIGRSFGIFVHFGSQFASSDVVSNELNKMIKVRFIMKLGNPSESSYWLGSPSRNRNNDLQRGHGFLNDESEFIRSFYIQDFFIEHELLKYDVQPIEGYEIRVNREPNLPIDIVMRQDWLKRSREAGEEVDQEEEIAIENFLKSFSEATAKFTDSIKRLRTKYHGLELTKPVKKPLSEKWNNESIESYAKRILENRNRDK